MATATSSAAQPAKPATASTKKQKSGAAPNTTSTNTTGTAGNHTADPLAPLKAQYKSQLVILRELFAQTWKDDDLVSVLQEVQGDLDVAISRISEGHAEHWATSSKKPKSATVKKTSDNASARDDTGRSGTRAPRGEFSARGGRGAARGGRAYSGPGREQQQPRSAPAAARGSYAKGPAALSAPAWGVEAKASTEDAAWGPSAATSAGNAVATSNDDWAAASVAATAGSESLSWDEQASTTASAWGENGTATAAAAAPPTPAKVAVKAPVAAVAPPAKKEPSSAPAATTIKKNSTWAQIARRPDPPKPTPPPVVAAPSPVPAPVKEAPAKRAPSPKRPASTAAATMDNGVTTSATVQVPAATEPQRVNKPAPSPMSAPVAQAPPPGFGDATPAAAQQQTAAAAATGGVRKNPVVVMPNKPQVSNVGVKFGSLSLGETEHAEAPAAAAAPAGSPPSAARAPVAAQPQQQQAAPQQYQQQQQQAVPQQTGFGFGFPAGMDTAAGNAYTAAYGMNADYASFYADAQRAATDVSAASGNANPAAVATPQQQQHMNANLANMYAAYYPYYMNHQFPPGASPFGNTAPAAPGYGQPFGAPPAVAPVPAAKYPYQGGAPTGAPQQQGQVQGQQQQPGANKPPATASTAGIYGGYNAYGGAPAAADDSQDAYGKYQPFLQGSGAGGQKQDKPQPQQQHPQQNQQSVANAAYYGQYMHPAVHQYGAPASYGMPYGQPPQQPSGGPQQQQQRGPQGQGQPQQQQQQYWGQ